MTLKLLKASPLLLVLAACETSGERAGSQQVETTGAQVSGLLNGPLNSIPATCNSCHTSHKTATAKLSQRISPAAGLTPIQDASRTINTRLRLGQQCFINKLGQSNIARMQHFAGPTNAVGQLGAFRATLTNGKTVDALMIADPIRGTNQAVLSMVFPNGEFTNCTL